jgi:hypothetical protein
VVNLEAVNGRHARCQDSIDRLGNSKPWECDVVTLPFAGLMENWLVAVDRWGGMLEAEGTFRGQLEIVRMKGRQTIIGVCCNRCMLY